MHPSSVVAQLATPQLHHPYLVYLEKVGAWGRGEWGGAAAVAAWHGRGTVPDLPVGYTLKYCCYQC